MPRVAREVTVPNENGLHARPAMMFVDLANQFTSAVRVFRLGEDPADVDGKSIMQLLTLAATQGTTLRIEADGEDAENAVNTLCDLVASGFDE